MNLPLRILLALALAVCLPATAQQDKEKLSLIPGMPDLEPPRKDEPTWSDQRTQRKRPTPAAVRPAPRAESIPAPKQEKRKGARRGFKPVKIK